MKSGYLVVTIAENPNYYFASLKTYKSLEVLGKRYGGSGRSWDYRMPSNAPEELKAIVNKAEDCYSHNLQYGFFEESESALMVSNWLNSSDDINTYEVIELRVYRQNESLPSIVSDNSFLGVDIDCDGCYPIKEELFAAQITSNQQPEFNMFFHLLNDNGLFNSHEDAAKYVDCYLSIQSERNIEHLQKSDISYCYIFAIHA